MKYKIGSSASITVTLPRGRTIITTTPRGVTAAWNCDGVYSGMKLKGQKTKSVYLDESVELEDFNPFYGESNGSTDQDKWS